MIILINKQFTYIFLQTNRKTKNQSEAKILFLILKVACSVFVHSLAAVPCNSVKPTIRVISTMCHDMKHNLNN